MPERRDASLIITLMPRFVSAGSVSPTCISVSPKPLCGSKRSTELVRYGRDEVIFKPVGIVELINHVIYSAAELTYFIIVFVALDSSAEVAVRDLARNVAYISQRSYYRPSKYKSEYR